MDQEKKAPVKPYLPSELAALYGISVVTLKNVWLRPFVDTIGPRAGNYYNILQVKIIFERLGEP